MIVRLYHVRPFGFSHALKIFISVRLDHVKNLVSFSHALKIFISVRLDHVKNLVSFSHALTICYRSSSPCKKTRQFFTCAHYKSRMIEDTGRLQHKSNRPCSSSSSGSSKYSTSPAKILCSQVEQIPARQENSGSMPWLSRNSSNE